MGESRSDFLAHTIGSDFIEVDNPVFKEWGHCKDMIASVGDLRSSVALFKRILNGQVLTGIEGQDILNLKVDISNAIIIKYCQFFTTSYGKWNLKADEVFSDDEYEAHKYFRVMRDKLIAHYDNNDLETVITGIQVVRKNDGLYYKPAVYFMKPSYLNENQIDILISLTDKVEIWLRRENERLGQLCLEWGESEENQKELFTNWRSKNI
jgi:hypothetical protein